MRSWIEPPFFNLSNLISPTCFALKHLKINETILMLRLLLLRTEGTNT